MSFLIYGAYGYTGELIAREAVARGERPVLAGRRREPLEALAHELELPHRAFDLAGPADGWERAFSGIRAVVHCAGPFLRTARPMASACLAAGVHYLDITGEISVFEEILAHDTEAGRAGVVLLPGVGFDVVPSDCLAARLARALPDAVYLELAFASDRGGWSRGTLRTMIESLPHAGAIRREGRIVAVPPAYDAKTIRFDHGERLAATIPWGDVATAYHTTGIPNIRVYTAMPPAAVRRLRRLAPLLPVAGLRPVKGLLSWWAGKTVTGPGEEVRRSARVHLWGRVENAAGATATATLSTPEGYRFTATAAVECTRRVLAGEVAAGAWTPARAFGADFVDRLPGVASGEIRGTGLA